MAGYISAGNFYSSDERLKTWESTGDYSDPAMASEWFDLPILLIGSFHCIAWVRIAVLFCVVFLNINLMWVWYLTTFTTIFGIVAYAVAIMRYFSETGMEAAEAQPNRAMFIFVEICICWLAFLFEFIPFIIRCKNKASMDEDLLKSDEDDEDEEDD